MLTIVVGLALTTVLIAALSRRTGINAADKGSMSSNWVADRAGERRSSV